MMAKQAHLATNEVLADGMTENNTNLWETILKEVGSSKAVATKKVLVLGDPDSGKTGVVSQLFQASLQPHKGNSPNIIISSASAAVAASAAAAAGGGTAASAMGNAGLSETSAEIDALMSMSKHDLALSYFYMDIHDEDNEETIARLGIYQLASDRATDRELLNFVLDARSFSDSAAVIVLDWSKPWRFVKSLLRWINVLSNAIEVVCQDTAGRESSSNNVTAGWTQGKAIVDECRERLERFLQEYTEASADDIVGSGANVEMTEGGVSSNGTGVQSGSSGFNVAARAAADILLPLGDSVLTSNLGIPLIVVCTKSDSMLLLERERGFKEEDFDFIQQVLRTVCLRFGAALVYTSTHNPATFSTLYHYLVHRLLTHPSSSITAPIAGAEDNSAEMMDVSPLEDNEGKEGSSKENGTHAEIGLSMAATTNELESQSSTNAAHTSYPFRVRANVVDRDIVFVPSGWDSISKINYLRESFDVALSQAAWANDEKRYEAIVSRALRSSKLTTNGREANSSSSSLSIALKEDLPEATTKNSALLMYSSVIVAPKWSTGGDGDGSSAVAAVTAVASGMANQVSVEDDQTFLGRLYSEQEKQMAVDGENEVNLSASENMHALRLKNSGSSSNRFVSNLLRSVNSAESSLSTALDIHEPQEAHEGRMSDDEDSTATDTPPSSATGSGNLAKQQSARFPPPHTQLQNENADVAASLGRASGNRLQRSAMVSQAQSGSDAAQVPSQPRRKLTLNSATSGNSTPSGDPGSGASNEDLTSFFQNLLGHKGRPSAAATISGKSSPQQQSRPLGGSLSRASGLSHKDVQAELERLRSQLKREKE